MPVYTHTTSENEAACRELPQSSVSRALQTETSLCFIPNGGNGLRWPASLVYRRKTTVQRRQWHQIENVNSHRSWSRPGASRLYLLLAHELPDCDKAKATLLKIHMQLRLQNEPSAASLLDGLEKSRTPQKLGLFRELGRSFKTTKVIESACYGLAQRIERADHWRNSNQPHGWLASARLDVEFRLRDVCGYQHLYRLRQVLQNLDQAEAAQPRAGSPRSSTQEGD